jgi:hypothetical protein
MQRAGYTAARTSGRPRGRSGMSIYRTGRSKRGCTLARRCFGCWTNVSTASCSRTDHTSSPILPTPPRRTSRPRSTLDRSELTVSTTSEGCADTRRPGNDLSWRSRGGVQTRVHGSSPGGGQPRPCAHAAMRARCSSHDLFGVRCAVDGREGRAPPGGRPCQRLPRRGRATRRQLRHRPQRPPE